MSDHILEVSNLTKKFGGLVANDNISFTVDRGEILGIIGPNGSGKSTLLNQVSGFFPPTSGQITFNGNDISRVKSHEAAKLGIGRNFQKSLLFMDLSVTDNVYYGQHIHYKTNPMARLLRTSSAKAEEAQLREKSIEILRRMDMEELKDELAGNLPHGYQRILSICIALAVEPSLLLLDEPLTGMNQTEVEHVLTLIRRLREDGITIVIIEHNMQAMVKLCDRFVVLDHGVKIADDVPEVVSNDETVIEAYLGKEE